MNLTNRTWALAQADFLERIRRQSFLVMLGFISFIGYLVYDELLVLRVGGYRGEFDSIWVGANTTLVVTMILTLFGFYLVKNSVQRDRETRVGQVLASTPMSRLEYVLGKTVSNFFTLSTFVVVLAVFGIVLLVTRGETKGFELWGFLAPFVILALPAMWTTAALAVFFEVIPWLRGALGNGIYLFVWAISMMLPTEGGVRFMDWAGVDAFNPSMSESASRQMGEAIGGISMRLGPSENPIERFRWEGMEWSAETLAIRLLWIVITLGIVGLSALLFDRFDTVREGRNSRRELAEESQQARNRATQEFLSKPSSLPAGVIGNRFSGIVIAELGLALKGRRWWWIGTLGLWVAAVAAPLNAVQMVVVPITWLWPVAIWSAMGCRESVNNTSQLVFSTRSPLLRLLSAQITAGVMVSLLVGAAALSRYLVAGDTEMFVSLLVGSLFVPSLAYALGVWSNSSRLFEVVYFLLLYVGPINKTLSLDFLGSTPGTWAAGNPGVFFAASIVLLLAAFVGRRVRIVH